MSEVSDIREFAQQQEKYIEELTNKKLQFEKECEVKRQEIEQAQEEA